MVFRVLLFLLFSSIVKPGICQIKNVDNKYLLTLSRKDNYHGKIVEYFYLEERALYGNQLVIDDKVLIINRFQYFEFGDYLYNCCFKKKGNADNPDTLTYYSKLTDSVNRVTSSILPYKLKKAYRGYNLTVSKVNFDYCHCTPQFDNKYADGTEAVSLFPKRVISISELTLEERLFFDKNFKTIARSSFVKKLIPAFQ